jgi:hypothetical protein
MEGSLACSQQPATGTYPDPYVSNPHNFPPYFLKIHSNLILTPTTTSSELSSRQVTK